MITVGPSLIVGILERCTSEATQQLQILCEQHNFEFTEFDYINHIFSKNRITKVISGSYMQT